jgi:serine/threonine protein phosphatase PrpC
VNADVTELRDIRPGDYFLLCSDGVWGAVPDSELLDILQKDISDEDKIENIRQMCEQDSKDNYSAYLVRIHEVSDAKDSSPEPASQSRSVQVEDTSKPSGMKWAMRIALLLLLGWFLYKMFTGS